MSRLTVPVLAALVLAVLLAGPAPAMARAQPSTALQRTGGSLKQCAADLWWGVKDSAKDTADIIKSCVTEQTDDIRFWLEDVRKLVAVVKTQLQEAVAKCAQSGAAGCAQLLLAVASAQLKPAALLFADGLRMWLRLAYAGVLQILGCSALPALLPFVWNTLLDTILFGQCLLQQ